MSVMARYHALARTLVRGEGGSHGASRAALHYRTLVRLQHRQSLLQMFEPFQRRVGAPAFERIVDALRRAEPPRDPNPSRWALSFAAHVAERDDVDERAKALAELLALRVAVNVAPDVEWERGIRPGAELRAFRCDPRAELEALDASPPAILAVYRDDAERVRAEPLDRDAVAVWGVESGEADLELLVRSGVGEEALARGRARLVALGLLRDSDQPASRAS